MIGFNEDSHGDTPRNSWRNFEEAEITHASKARVDGYAVVLDDGTALRVTGEHQFLITQPSKKAAHWRRADELFDEINNRTKGGMAPMFHLPRYFNTWVYSESREAGYLAGAFDADGTLILGEAKNGDLIISFSQYDNPCLAEVKRCLDVLGFKWGEVIVDQMSKTASQPSHIIKIKGGFTEGLRFLGMVRPPRLLSRWERYYHLNDRKLQANDSVKIVAIYKEKIDIAVLSSSSKTYFSDGFGSHNSNRAGGIVDHANGLLMAMPSFTVEALDQTTGEGRLAEQLERVLAALFEHQLLANDFWNSVGRDLLIYARAFIKALPLTSVWTEQEGYPVRFPDEPSKEYLARVRDWKDTAGKVPFVIQWIPANSVLTLLDSNDNPLASVEEKWVSAKILADEFGCQEVEDALSQGRLRWYDELSVVEYIDTEYVGYFLAGLYPRDRSMQTWEPHLNRARAYTELRIWPHGLGKHPIVLIPGIRTEMMEYEDHFKGFLHDAQQALEGYDFLISRLATMVYAYYLPSYQWTIGSTTAQYAGRERPTLQVNLGGVTVTYADEVLQVLPVPQGLPDATMLLQQLDDIIQRHTLEDVLFGRVPGSAPAFQVALRINVAKSKLTPIAQHMAQGLTNVCDLFLRTVESLGEAVVIDGEKITVSMAKKYRGRLAVQIEPKSPVDRNQDIGAANAAAQFGLPFDWICEEILDIDDPATIRLQKDILEIENLPPVKEKLMADALEQLEILVEEDETEDISGMDMSTMPPEFAAAIQQLTGGGGEDPAAAGDTPDIASLIQGMAGGGEENPGLGHGPYPEGMAPQSIQGGRGLMTPKTQPQPGSPQVAAPGLTGGFEGQVIP